MDSANVSIILQSAHEEAEKIRAYSDFDLLALVARGSNGKASQVKRAAVEPQEKPARQPRKAGVKAVAKVAAAGKKARDGSGVAAVESFLKDRAGEWGIAKIIEGTGLARGAVNGALKALRASGSVKDNGGGKRDMMYKYVGL